MGDWRTVIILAAAILLVADEIYENRTGKELFKMPPRVARWLILFTMHSTGLPLRESTKDGCTRCWMN